MPPGSASRQPALRWPSSWHRRHRPAAAAPSPLGCRPSPAGRRAFLGAEQRRQACPCRPRPGCCPGRGDGARRRLWPARRCVSWPSLSKSSALKAASATAAPAIPAGPPAGSFFPSMENFDPATGCHCRRCRRGEGHPVPQLLRSWRRRWRCRKLKPAFSWPVLPFRRHHAAGAPLVPGRNTAAAVPGQLSPAARTSASCLLCAPWKTIAPGMAANSARWRGRSRPGT